MIIDTHCHFDMMPNPEGYISAKEKAGDIVIGMTNLPSHFKMGQSHLIGYKHIRLALGLHPLLAAENRKELTLFKRLVDQTSYIGEIGLDFSTEGIATKNEQISVLWEVLATIKGKKKIVSVHSRNAEKELLDMLCEFEIKNVIFHWYSGPVDLIPAIIERGFYFSINESMCRSKNGQSIIGKIPREKILTETDAPYNKRTNIRMVLNQLNMSEVDIFYNFNRLLNDIK
ncbi:MAG: TatD family hydrolase [Bacteroidales bacterium]|uniref:TatD family hydrolase n=1 Tax=Candidatus Cryptobacteroides bacterium TaxID=3085639 RepID=UPI002F9B3E57